MKELYHKIINQFSKEDVINIFTKEGISQPQYIDLYSQQDLDQTNTELLTKNNLLIDWTVNHKEKSPIATLVCRLSYGQFHNTSEHGTDDFFLTYIDKVHQVLKGLETKSTGKLNLIDEGFNHDEKSTLNVYLLQYECSYSGKSDLIEFNGSYDKIILKNELKYDF
ncbi:hypothetical protein [Empedobacter brevis]|uniref:hypothetical protein n=1 Tax=Empedobacter brevis TaxID=247 RepID=UPI00289C7846|nr:hypothetical protein [Empedobacter brevis]